jgi:hypothetical protein
VAISSASGDLKHELRGAGYWQTLCKSLAGMRDDLLHGDVTEQIIGGFYEAL